MSADLSRLLDATLIGFNYDGWGRLTLQFDNATDLYVEDDNGAGFHIDVVTVGVGVTEETPK